MVYKEKVININIIWVIIIIFNLFFINNSYSQDYQINNSQSKIQFSTKHSGNKITGNITKWQSDIFFDHNNPENSKIKAVFDVQYIKTANNIYDKALITKDWLDLKNYPKARFQSLRISKKSDNIFTMIGNLTIKGISKRVDFDFTLSDPNKNTVIAKSNFKINRLDYNIGRESDEIGEWVDLQINIDLILTAQKIND